MKISIPEFIGHALRRFASRAEHHLIAKIMVVSLLCCVGIMTSALWPSEPSAPAPTSFLAEYRANPASLSDADVASYRSAFTAISHGTVQGIKETLATVENKRLVGYVLAQLYLSPNYTASSDELAEWVSLYSDHPQADKITRLALNRGASVPIIDQDAPLKGDGYAEHLGRSTMPDSWYRGLSLWREQNFKAAQPLFADIGNNKNLSSWQRAAGYYWAYRASDALHEDRLAHSHLQASSRFKTTFYGLLAIQQLGTRQAEAKAPHVTANLRNSPRALRASLLSQLGRNDEAEIELRYLYSAASKSERAGIITLAHELNFANLQVRLAGLSELSAEEEVFASYPLPQYVIDAQAEQPPSLMLAIARNESGFRDTASSGAGAVGLMQMLPSTASGIERRVGLDALRVASNGATLEPIAERLNDPATSVRYSAKYLEILSRQPAVGTNLVRILAAYNAGPGTVSNWQPMATKINDPLLYIESIPYPETRNYVMQVLAHSWVYAGLLGETPSSLKELSSGQWPTLDNAI